MVGKDMLMRRPSPKGTISLHVPSDSSDVSDGLVWHQNRCYIFVVSPKRNEATLLVYVNIHGGVARPMLTLVHVGRDMLQVGGIPERAKTALPPGALHSSEILRLVSEAR